LRIKQADATLGPVPGAATPASRNAASGCYLTFRDRFGKPRTAAAMSSPERPALTRLVSAGHIHSGSRRPASSTVLLSTVDVMFIEMITAPTEEFQQWTERLRLVSDPPDALVASFAWRSGDGTIASINVWDSASDIADFFIDRVQAIVDEKGPPEHKPERLGEAVHAYIRPAT
jgi:hypothetical protein